MNLIIPVSEANRREDAASSAAVDELVRILQREEAIRLRDTIRSSVAGGVIGLILGVAQLVVIASEELLFWPLMPMIPIYSALGWALFGMIVGGSGLLSKRKPASRIVAGQSMTRTGAGAERDYA